MERIRTLGAASLAALMAAQRQADLARDSRAVPLAPNGVTDGNSTANARANGNRRPNLWGVMAQEHRMRHGRRNLLAIGAAGLLAGPLLTRRAFAQAASTTRIHGTVTGLKADALAVQTTGGRAVSIAFGPKTPIVGVAAASLADIKPGDFVGTAARPGDDGGLVALEVHIFPESMRGTGEGHRPFDMGPQSTMTNGTVGADVTGVSGRTITVSYKGGQQKVFVPPNVPVVRFEPGDQSLLTAGAHVSITASEDAAGALSALRISVGKAGLTPPV
jgi:hypothetical protein